MKQIGIENNNIKNFFKLKRYTGWKEAVTELGLLTDIRTIREEVIELESDFDKIHKNDNAEVYNSLDTMFRVEKRWVLYSRVLFLYKSILTNCFELHCILHRGCNGQFI